jgi:pyruvate/2-oxoglutarate dehydrogenase complex dihydrolipoamide acyltransferase (E2) component
MAEGRRKNTVYAFVEFDITDLRIRLRELKQTGQQSISLTAYLTRCFARTLTDHQLLNSYRKGRRRLMCFDEVDVAVMVEKEIENQLQPIHFIVRDANHKSLSTVNTELQFCRNAPVEKVVTSLDRTFFGKIPDGIRRMFWWITRKDPQVKKKYSGTVGLTNIGMFGQGNITVLPITPMTCTLAIGTIDKKLILTEAGELQNREILHATICVDHDIVDGSPMTRFVMDLKTRIESLFELPQSLSLLYVSSSQPKTQSKSHPEVS